MLIYEFIQLKTYIVHTFANWLSPEDLEKDPGRISFKCKERKITMTYQKLRNKFKFVHTRKNPTFEKRSPKRHLFTAHDLNLNINNSQ